MAKAMRFSASHAKDTRYKGGGLRSFFLYRDLGIKAATSGQAMAHVIRAKSAHAGGGGWHHHSLKFQMYYVIKGWIEFEYEGVGIVRSKAGSCVHQPPNIRHKEIAHSRNLELIEITLPGTFKTHDDVAPTKGRRDRRQ